ncbi:hypothetical protein [Xanthomonas sacchari]|uniref:hypothetical protein n=1 Tax=Xanthomonas sacchari TaxID=56458 RepID=UPI0020C2F4B4|nr:hypothetical protein [Xanthomonas sacchari]
MPPPPMPAARNQTIDAMAKLSLLLGVLSLLYALGQALLLMALPDGAVEDVLREAGLPLPPLLQWCVVHAQALSWLSALLAAGLCAASWALLQRRDWARRAFIVFLVVTAAANFAVLPLLWQLIDLLQAWAPLHAFDPQQLQHDLALGRITLMISGALTALVFAGLHGWLVYQLCRPAIRAEFHR